MGNRKEELPAGIQIDNMEMVELVVRKKEADDPLLDSLTPMIGRWLPLSDKTSIYRVPRQLFALQQSAYLPKLISIGPLHHVEMTEEYKLRFLSDFLKSHNVSLKSYLNFTREREPRVRECYADTLNCSVEELVKIIVIDAAFVLEVLIRNFSEKDTSCRVFNRPYLPMNIIDDLLLLENQLPLFFLEELYVFANIQVVEPSTGESVPFLKLVCEFLTYRVDMGVKEYNLDKVRRKKPHHFLDCMWTFHLNSIEDKLVKKVMDDISVPSAMHLYRAGVKFVKSPSEHLLDLKFEDGVLSIPHIFMGSTTELIFRNLLAFEQCHHMDNLLLTNYFSFMNKLIVSSEDVGLLIRRGIIKKHVSDDEKVAAVFNGLARHLLVYNESFFADLNKKLCDFYGKPWHKRKAELKHKCFNSPWAGICACAVVLFLVLTIIRTAMALWSYLHPPK